MFARLAGGKVKPSTWEQYGQLYHDEILPQTREVKGLRFRELLRDADDPDAGISWTLWETHADLDAYE
jgi:heme-degrading monooxygenase HmoA